MNEYEMFKCTAKWINKLWALKLQCNNETKLFNNVHDV